MEYSHNDSITIIMRERGACLLEYLVMVRGNQLVIGQLLNIEGELMEVVVKEPNKVKVGETWSCKYESISFKSKVLKKDGLQLYLYLPLLLEKFPENRRKLPRMDCEFPAFLYKVKGGSYFFQGTATIIDFTVKGFGFITNDDLDDDSVYSINIQGDTLDIKPNIKIMNKTEQDSYFRYGCELLSIPEEDNYALREYVLSRQIQATKLLEIADENIKIPNL